jgi:hypothetical protein
MYSMWERHLSKMYAIDKCDPQNWPKEIDGEKSPTGRLRPRLSTLFPQEHRHSVAHFRPSSGRSGEGRERARKLATRWLCWQSEANPSLPAIWGIAGRFGPIAGTMPSHPAEDPLHLSGLDGFLPNSRSRETIILSREGRIRITVPVFFEINSRVINGHPIANEGCLLHPQERTCSASEPMSAKCQKLTPRDLAPQSLFPSAARDVDPSKNAVP